MAFEEGRFFTGAISDRRFQADALAEYFRSVVTSGVAALGTNLQVTANGTGMTVQVGYGEAFVDGFLYRLRDNGTGVKQLSIDASNAQPRIDRVVLRLNRLTLAESLQLAIKKGTPAASPSPPALTRNAGIYELSLAQVLVDTGVSAIAVGKVMDERADTNVCGIYRMPEERMPKEYLPLDGGIMQGPLNMAGNDFINLVSITSTNGNSYTTYPLGLSWGRIDDSNYVQSTGDNFPYNTGEILTLNEGTIRFTQIFFHKVYPDRVYIRHYASDSGGFQSWSRIYTSYFVRKLLWGPGSWSSGYIDVSGLQDYRWYEFGFANTDARALVYRSNTYILGGLFLHSSSTAESLSFGGTYSGIRLTWIAAKRLSHQASGGHGAGADYVVSSIYGLL